jgi:hypothetical protein
MTIKHNKWPQNTLNAHKIKQASFNDRPSKIYPNQGFGFENMPSGNPDLQMQHESEKENNFKCINVISKR